MAEGVVHYQTRLMKIVAVMSWDVGPRQNHLLMVLSVQTAPERMLFVFPPSDKLKLTQQYCLVPGVV